MLRPFAALAAVAILGLLAVRFVFGVTVGIIGMLLGLVLKITLVCAIIYLGLCIISPDTAKKMKEHFTQ
jgi:hypothetical protein